MAPGINTPKDGEADIAHHPGWDFFGYVPDATEALTKAAQQRRQAMKSGRMKGQFVRQLEILTSSHSRQRFITGFAQNLKRAARDQLAGDFCFLLSQFLLFLTWASCRPWSFADIFSKTNLSAAVASTARYVCHRHSLPDY